MQDIRTNLPPVIDLRGGRIGILLREWEKKTLTARLLLHYSKEEFDSKDIKFLSI